jgi:hypothetical protein
MASGFINKLPGGISVDHRPAETQFGEVDLDSPPKGCGHTTEGTQLPSYREGQTDAPTFTIGERRVWQHRGLEKSCGTLQNLPGGIAETNRFIRIQFELIGFSSQETWLPRLSFQRDALVAIKELAHDELGVPRDHVWPDKQDGGTIAVDTYHRRHSKFPSMPGWYGHVEIPENSHWTGDRCVGTTSRQDRTWLMHWHSSNGSRTPKGNGGRGRSHRSSQTEVRFAIGP